MNKTLIIPRTLANRLLGLAQHTPDAEICGLVFLVPMLQRGNPGFQTSLISKSHTEIEN